MWFTRILLGLLGILLVGSPPWTIEAFNVETKHHAVYHSEAKSMFGFAVSVYRDAYGRGWAIVGAPEAETAQVSVYRGGAVYRCDIAADDRCSVIHFDDTEHNYVRNRTVSGQLTQIDNKTLQWFGATVSASYKDGGPILACAPRYIWFSVSQSRFDSADYRWNKELVAGNRREPVGTCWVVENNFNESQEFSPCRTRYWGYHRQGSCQAGLGASMSKSGERLFIGAPGSWYWQGQIFSQPLNKQAKVMFTKEGPANEDDSYMGFSVTTGDFVGNGDSGTAVGVPRGSGLRGKVVLFTSNMTNHQNVTGEQMGAYFGYAVASGDIDGDGLDDLIIGAPMYTIPDNPEMTIETGRIYVMYQGTGLEKFRKVDNRDGESNRGRFGLSLSSLGDIDRDGYGDFAVGAPYAGPNGRGAVYIYHGSKVGVLEKYSQVIHAEDVDVPVQTFGFSVAGGLDLDGNHYPDMVVGAYESSMAMFFRSRPVIKMDSYVTFETESKLISLDTRNCTLSDSARVTCFPLRACFKYTGDGVLSRHNFNIQYVLDVKKTKNPRLFFLELEGRNVMNHTITVERERQFCRTVQVYVTPNVRDKLTSLDAEIRMSLNEDRIPDNRPRDPRVPLRPILGTTTSRKDALSIRKNCGPDNICIPDLQLNVQPNVGRYLLGSGKKLELKVFVENRGEDAFEATYNLKLPMGIDYIKIERIDKTEVPVQCSAPKQTNNNTLRCDIGNPLPQKQLVKFNVLLQPVTSHGMKPSYEFDMEVNTTNPEQEATTNDNSQHLSLPIWIETELLIEGKSKPDNLFYTPSNYTTVNVTSETEFGPAMVHNYTIRNQGPSDILEAEAFLVWPAQTLAGEELVYLLDQPETAGPIACEPANANYLSLKLDQRNKVHLNYLDPSGVILDESHSGKTINVQRGLDPEHKSSQKDEIDINSGDSSDIQKTRHSSSSNIVTTETRKIQLTTGGDKPDVLTTTYTQNKSSVDSIPRTNNREMVFHTGSGNYGGDSTVLGSRLQTSVDEKSFNSNLGNIDRSHINHNTEFESHWSQTNTDETTISSSIDSATYVESGKSHRQYQEILEQQRRRQEEAALKVEEQSRLQEKERLLQHQREELLALQRQWEERNRQRQQTEQHQLATALERRHEEEYRRRQQEKEEEYDYAEERRQSGATENYDRGKEPGLIAGDREETINSGEIGFHLRNISSTQELANLFGSLSKEANNYRLYSRQGRQYVQFMARFRTSADKKEYIEFQDGSMFPLQDYRGIQSYASDFNVPQDSRFLRIEGQLLIDQNGKGYIILKDNRRFPLQGSYTYTEERTYSSHGGSRDKFTETKNDEEQVTNTYGRSSHEMSSNRNENNERYDTRIHEEKQFKDRKVNTRIYDAESSHGTVESENSFTGESDPNLLSSRFRRESDTMTVDEFRRFEKHHRYRRDLKEILPLEESISGSESDYENESRIPRQTPPCDAAKCVRLRCVLGPLKKDQEVWLGVRYLVSARTLMKVAFQEKVKVSSQLIARVTKQPFIGTPVEQVVKNHEIYTNVVPDIPSTSPDVVPLWVVVLSACAGTIILLLLIFLLHKCGFFKRNRPSDAPERQPLNRNGHFQQGDDHL